MRGLQALGALVLLAGAGVAHAGIIFTPHLSEYSKLPPGQYTEFTFVYTDIEDVYDRNGKRVHAGSPRLVQTALHGEADDAAVAVLHLPFRQLMLRMARQSWIEDMRDALMLLQPPGDMQRAFACLSHAQGERLQSA